jgi:hypothetical protein
MVSAEVDFLTSAHKPLKAKASLFPNPAKNSVGVEFSVAAASHAGFQVYSATGALVLSKMVAVHAGQNRVSIPMETLQPGSYFLKANGGNWVLQEFFIKI